MKNKIENKNNSQRSESVKGKFSREWKIRYIPIFSILSALFVLFLVLILTLPTTMPSPSPEPSESGWRNHVFAPFVDLSSWVPLTSEYSQNGVPNLALVEEQTGIGFYNLGFIQPDMEKPLDADGNIRYGWGGLYELSEKGNDGYQYPKIAETIKTLQKMGVSYAISVGGQLGDAPWIVTSDVEKLEDFYLDIIETYDLKRLDLDIEESNQVQSANILNAKAIKSVQDKTGIEVVLTIPIMPSGWQDKQIKIIRAYLDQGVHISLINSMTMCYGAGVYEDEDYGDASIRALDNSIRQMQEIWASYGSSLTEQQAYQKTGATIDIGFESSLYPTFTTEMAAKVVSYAKEHNLGMLSYWSINRDAKMEANKGITNQYEFLAEMNKFSA